LVAKLRDPESTVRLAAVEALATCGLDVPVTDLLERLEDTDAQVRAAAARAVGTVGAPRRAETPPALQVQYVALAIVEEIDKRFRTYWTHLMLQEERRSAAAGRDRGFRLLESWGATGVPVVLGALIALLLKIGG